jgi:hypothetical protein
MPAWDSDTSLPCWTLGNCLHMGKGRGGDRVGHIRFGLNVPHPTCLTLLWFKLHPKSEKNSTDFLLHSAISLDKAGRAVDVLRL